MDPHPAVIDLVHATRLRLDETVERFEEHTDHGLSLTDVTTIVLAEHHDVGAVLSFDGGCDSGGLLGQVAPSAV